MTAEAAAPAASAAVHPLIGRMCTLLAAPLLDSATFDAWAAAPGHALLVFTEEPKQFAETLDLAVVVPELAHAYAGRFRTGVLLQQAARAIAPRFGFRRWPAVVLLKDGLYVGAIDGLRDWQEYVDQLGALLRMPPARPPSIGISVKSAGPERPNCH
ncbi:MAG: hydrogenase [Gemmatimonadota bacterium]